MPVIAFLLSLALPQAQAQVTGVPDHSQHVEALRPRVAPRPLSADEAKARDEAIARFRAAPGLEALILIQPFAETGDRLAMRAMMDGYVQLREAAAERDKALGTSILGRTEYRLAALGGLWAMKLWQAGEGDPAIAKALRACVQGWNSRFPRELRQDITLAAMAERFDCGFDVTISRLSNDRLWGLAEDRYDFKKADRARIKFAERPVHPQRAVDRIRLTWFLSQIEQNMKNGTFPYIWPEDMEWANEVAARDAEFAAAFYPVAYKYWLWKAPLLYAAPESHKGFWAYVRADATRDKTLRDALEAPRLRAQAAALRRTMDETRFDERIANRSYHLQNDKYWMAQVAFRSAGQRAQQWYAIWGGDLTGSGYRVDQWCTGAEVAAACGFIEREKRAQAAADAARANGGAGYRPGAPDSSALTNHLNSVNRANCARALMGANIPCNLP